MSTPADFSVWGGKKFVLTAVLPGAGGVTYRCCQCEFLFTSRFPSRLRLMSRFQSTNAVSTKPNNHLGRGSG